jgi:Tfp pilus assembly protein PilV
MPRRFTDSRTVRPCGLSTIEVAISTVLVGAMLIGAMNLLGASMRGRNSDMRRAKAIRLAEDLMSEILQQRYSEPTDAAAFGPEGSEPSAAIGPRTLWDDVDDYHASSETPPQTKDGEVMPDCTGWRRWVEVKYVDPDDLAVALADTDDRGVKRITVQVSYNGAQLASLVGVQTQAWLDMIPEPENDQTTGSLPPVNQSPVANIAANPPSGNGPLTVNFDATGSTDPDNDPLTYFWDFGDGETASGAKVSHTFTYIGLGAISRTVTLTATDVNGGQASSTVNIIISGITL